MKKKKFNEELQGLNHAQLIEKINQMRQELFNLRMSKNTSHTKDFSLFSKLRKNIARALTVLPQKEQGK